MFDNIYTPYSNPEKKLEQASLSFVVKRAKKKNTPTNINTSGTLFAEITPNVCNCELSRFNRIAVKIKSNRVEIITPIIILPLFPILGMKLIGIPKIPKLQTI